MRVITVKQLRAMLPKLVERVSRGARFTVVHRGRPAFQIVPVDEGQAPHGVAEDDPLYRAGPVGGSTDRRSAADHDAALYER